MGAENVALKAITSGGCSMYSRISTADTNAQVIKASAGQLYGGYITNTSAAALKVNFYNKATTPTPGTDTPVLRLVIPGATTGAGSTISLPVGAEFTNGISFSMHANLTSDTDAASTVTAGALILNAFHK